jgi:PAS domain S-box-containing protein
MVSPSQEVLRYSYSYSLVALSFLIAAMASYAAFNLADRIAIYRDRKRLGWLAGGAIAMGIGIWSMHYTGMLAFNLPLVVTYHLPTVALSLFAAVGGSAVALIIVSRDRLPRYSLAMGGLALGSAIGTMHYIGMAAMRGQMMTHYSSGLVVLSIVVAVGFSCLALWLMFYFRFRQANTSFRWLKLTAAVVMGSGIACMHYTAMSAASFTPANMPPDTFWSLSVSELAIAGIIAATMLVLLGALLTSWLDRRLSLERISQQVLESVNIVLWRADPRSLRLNFLSSSAGRVLGDGIQERTDLWIDRIHSDDIERVRSHYEIAARSKEESQLEYRFIKDDGETIWVREVVRSTSERGTKYLMGTTRDVTDSKMLEQALVAEEKLAALGRLSAAIAHEINNPLQAALNLIFVADGTADPQRHDFLKRAQQELRRAAEIARITLGFYKGGDSYAEVDFDRISSDLAFLFEPRLHDKGVTFATKIRGRASLLGHEGEIRQILSNLMSNALDAVREDGTINLRISPSQDWRNGPRPGVRMTVFDNGRGFSARAVDRAFVPFFTTKKGTGTGLGLWVVKQLAEKYHGRITIRTSQAASKHGSAVSVFLPREP